MKTNRITATIVGILFIVGTVSGILSVVVTGSIFSDQAFLARIAESPQQVVLGAFFILLMGFSLAMVPVLMYPLFKQRNPALALGAVVFRGPLEAFAYMGQALSFLALVSLSQLFLAAGSPVGSHYQTIGAVLVQAGSQINTVLMVAFSIGALMFYTLFYQTRLIPRWLSIWGIAGAAIYLAAALLGLFGMGMDFLVIPLAVQEMVLAVYLIGWGFSGAE